jgi:quercetin dioxygenase-like cupin family protein
LEVPSPIRRVVTGHNADNVAVVLMDEYATNVDRLPHGVRTLLWSTQRMPCDISVGEDIEDEGDRKLGTQPPRDGTRFTINDIPPGYSGPLHRTESLDYAVVLTGDIDMQLDDGCTVSLRPGDVVIQRGTNHSWINRGTTWGRILFVLIDAKPLGIGHAVAGSTTVGSTPERP